MVPLRKMNKIKIISFQCIYSTSGSQVAKPHPGSSGPKVGQDALPLQGPSHTPTLTQAGTMQSCQFTSQAHLWDVGRNWSWEENPRRHGENMETSHRNWPWMGIYIE